MHYDDNKPKIFRWVIYAIFILTAILLQNACGVFLEVFGARGILVLPLIISISMFEREVPAGLFGAISGIILDISNGKDGFNAIVLMILCATVSVLVTHLMQKNIVTALVLSFGGTLIYQIIYIITNMFGVVNLKILFTFYLPSLILTMLAVPIWFFAIKNIYSNHRVADE